MPNSKKTSIIIVNYRSRQLLESCLVSIFDKMVDLNFEILVVNNDEKENINDMPARFGGVKIINNLKNIGFGKAANLGAKNSTGKYLFFLNPDTRLLTGQKKIVSLLDENEKIGIISPQLVDEGGNAEEWGAGKFPSLFRVILNNLQKKAQAKKTRQITSGNAEWVSGAALFIKKELFDDLGGFDEDFFMYFEDIDLCRRARKKGKRAICLTEEKVEHRRGGSASDQKKQKKDYYVSQDHYFQKHHGNIQAAAVKFLRKIFISKNA
jgi:GT2 family glycosyltransferase